MNAKILARIALLAALAVAAPAAAQRSSDTPSASSYVPVERQASRTGWVHVDITGLKPRVASELDVDAARVPDTVEVPLSVAVVTCGVDRADVAAASGEPVAACRAQAYSADVRDAVRDGMDGTSPAAR